MLARAADALYWIGRYLERAENVARLMLVTSELAVEIEGLDEELARAQWEELRSALGGGQVPDSAAGRDPLPALRSMRWYLLDERNPMSVRESLTRARENARNIRELLTKEAFTDLNEVHRELDALRRRRLRDPAVAHDQATQAHAGIRAVLGSIDLTLSRDEGWRFMKLGEALERTERVLLVLRTKLPGLRQSASGPELPLLYARWRALLRGVASLENFRARKGAGLDPELVLRFLLFDPASPRSVLNGVQRIRRYLDDLPYGDAISEADRILGRLDARLRYDDEEIVTKLDLAFFCEETAQDLARAHDAITRQYFRH